MSINANLDFLDFFSQSTLFSLIRNGKHRGNPHKYKV
jgi:hypothetical protein